MSVSSLQKFRDFRRALPRPPQLTRRVVRARGLDFAVFLTPPVDGVAPLLCVNGGLLYDHRLLWPALSPFAQRRQLVLYDQRGRGGSSAPPGVHAARIEHDAGDIPAIRESLGIARWDVLGHSWGGGIAMLAACQDGAAVRRIVLVDAVGPRGDWLPAMHETALARLDPARRDALGRLDPAALRERDPEIHSAYSRAFYPAWFADGELARRFVPPHSESRTGAAVAARLRRDSYDWSDRMCALSGEVLVIHGESDPLPVRVAHEWIELLPNARLLVIPATGHLPFWEAPETFFGAVEAFLGRA